MRYNCKKIKDARIQRRFTQTELARLAGLSVSAVNAVESGKGPWLKAIREIEKVLGISNVIQAKRSA